MRMRATLFCAAAAMAVTAGAQAQTYTQNFSSTNLGGPRLYGDAVVEGGSLRLTTNDYGRAGAMVIGGGVVTGFNASFDYLYNNPLSFIQADGLSFNLAGVPDGTIIGAEQGSGIGLTVSYDIFDFNGDGFVGDMGIRVYFNGAVIAEAPNAISFSDRGFFRNSTVSLHDGNQLNVTYNGNAVFTNLVIPGFTPNPAYRFSFAARTGGERAEQRIDNVSITASSVSQDLCRAATPIFGDGVNWYDNTGAGQDGAANALCDNANSNQITNDVWYCWTAMDSGVVTMSTVGYTSGDTKLAVYQDCAPCVEARGILACNDDSQATLQSTVQLSVTAGTRYLVRVGNYIGNGVGPSAFSVRTATDCRADFNHDHVINSQDFFDFVTAFFTPCI